LPAAGVDEGCETVILYVIEYSNVSPFEYGAVGAACANAAGPLGHAAVRPEPQMRQRPVLVSLPLQEALPRQTGEARNFHASLRPERASEFDASAQRSRRVSPQTSAADQT